MKKNHPMVPLWIIVMEEQKLLISCQNYQRIETIIFCKLDHFCAALWTKYFFPSQNRDFDNHPIFKIAILRREKNFSLECRSKVVKFAKNDRLGAPIVLA